MAKQEYKLKDSRLTSYYSEGDYSNAGTEKVTIESQELSLRASLGRVFAVLLCALIIASLFRNDFQPPLFTDLLQRLASTPTITIPRINAADWGIFEVLAQILNFITFLVSGAINGLTIIFHTLGWLLGM